MNFPVIFNLMGVVILILSAFMLLPLAVSFHFRDPDTLSFFLSLIITLACGALLLVSTKKHQKEELHHREGFIVVSFSWLAISFFGCLPYYISGYFHSFTDAYFEAMSGFTTTGASILKDIEALPHGLLFWRSLTQWIGGMGIIVLSLAILPYLGVGGMSLFKAEVPELTVDKLKPRIIDTAKQLWIIYASLTALGIILLRLGGMSFFDACCHSFTALATGGFSTKNASIAAFDSPAIDYIMTVLMIMAGTNYSLYYVALRGRISQFWQNTEFLFYITLIIASITFISVILWLQDNRLCNALRYAAFQVASIITTTGYATADYEKWPVATQMLIIFLMLTGGMIGSTAGGIKQVRIILMLKQAYRELYQQIHPRAITSLKLDGKNVSKEVSGGIWGFLYLYITVAVAATMFLTILNVDIVTAATTVISSLSNVGPALAEAGPTDNYSEIPNIGKWILSICMLIGRLEIYTVIILFVPHFWKK
jgi:trk system potassium uptake protein TrkH